MLNPIFVVGIGNLSQWLSLIKFATKDKKKDKAKAKKTVDVEKKKGLKKSLSKNQLMRSLSSVFNLPEENESKEEDDSETDSLRGSFMMPFERKTSRSSTNSGKIKPKRFASPFKTEREFKR